MNEPTREQLAELLTPNENAKSYRQLVREGHREPRILMLADREHFLLTRAQLDAIEACAAAEKKT
jgi:hypothetical protein